MVCRAQIQEDRPAYDIRVEPLGRRFRYEIFLHRELVMIGPAKFDHPTHARFDALYVIAHRLNPHTKRIVQWVKARKALRLADFLLPVREIS